MEPLHAPHGTRTDSCDEPAGDLPVGSRTGAALLDANVVRAVPGHGLHRSNPASLRSFWAISAISSGA